MKGMWSKPTYELDCFKQTIYDREKEVVHSQFYVNKETGRGQVLEIFDFFSRKYIIVFKGV